MKFQERLRSVGFSSYADYLKSDHWREFKVKYRASGASVWCAVCGGGGIQLHHHTYERLGCELPTDVTPLCRGHHEAVHEWLKVRGRGVGHTAQAVSAIREAGKPLTYRGRLPKSVVRHLAAKVRRRVR